MKELLLSVFLFAQGVPQAGVSAGSVSGRLLGVDGLPASGVRVTALTAPDNPTSGMAVIVSIAPTDATGRYRLERIPPGRYFITAGRVDFPTYYPGVADGAGAMVVDVRPGSDIEGVDFGISADTAFKIFGRVIRGGNQTPSARERLTLSGPNLPSQSSAISPDGSFQFSNVRPGNYTILLVLEDGLALPRSVRVEDKDVVMALTVPLPATTVTGAVVVEGGGPRPRFSIGFQGTGTNTARVTSIVSSTGTFSVPLPPGDYQLVRGPLPNGYTYNSITAGTTDLLKDPLKVSATDSPEFVVTVGVSSPPPWVKLAGHVMDSSNKPATGVTAISLIGSAAGERVIHTAAVKADGSFEFLMVLPGVYAAVVSSAGSPRGRAITVTVGNKDVSDLRIAMQD